MTLFTSFFEWHMKIDGFWVQFFFFFETVFNANGYLQEFWVDIKPYLYTHAKSTYFYQEHRIECYMIKNS